MVVCKYWLQNNCRFGSTCKFEHPPKHNQNRFAALQTPSPDGRASSSSHAASSSNRGLPYALNKDQIIADLTKETPQWLLSAYGPSRDAPIQLFGGPMREISPEEMRLHHYLAVATGNPQAAVQEAEALVNEARNQNQAALRDIDGAIKYIIDGANTHPNRLDIVAQSKSAAKEAGAFGQPSQPSGGPSAFGQPSQPPSGTSAFGQPSQPAAGFSAFGQPTRMNAAPSAFGQPSQIGSAAAGLGTGNVFGRPSQPTAGAFGQPTPMGQGKFGQLTPAPQSTFGQPTPAPQSAFGQPSHPTSTFGQPSVPQQHNPFASATQPPPNPFGQRPGPQNPTPTQPASAIPAGNAFAAAQNPPAQAPNPFGQPAPAGPNAFAASNALIHPQAPSNPFGGATARVPVPAFGGVVALAASGTSGGDWQKDETGNPIPFPIEIENAYGPNSTFTHPDLRQYSVRDPSNRLLSWKGHQVQLVSNVPCFKDSSDANDGDWEAISFPDGPPAYTAETEMDENKYDEKTKEAYLFLRDNGVWKDGWIPMLPPRREWCRWDF
ncbi:MAG: hypothetical protein M1825_004227 [Sarcosagium campestre]|nr:MAG: hypothetical protein M1825_004227 [Sarcosagium campestre]